MNLNREMLDKKSASNVMQSISKTTSFFRVLTSFAQCNCYIGLSV